LKGIKPLAKFLIIKFVVFITFWHGIIISLCNYFGAIKPTLEYSQEDVDDGIKDLLICIEMAFAAVGHHLYYNSDQFNENDIEIVQTKHSVKNAIIHSVVPSDMIIHIKKMVSVKKSKKKRSLGVDKKNPKIEIVTREITMCCVCKESYCVCDAVAQV
jgi:hypothetical protein